MEFQTIFIAGVAGYAAHWLGDVLKNWLSARKQSTQFEVRGPAGEKMKISIDAAHAVDPVAIKKRILLDMLKDPKYKFGRDFERLKAAIAASDQETKDLLLLVGARHNLNPEGKDTWTLQPL